MASEQRTFIRQGADGGEFKVEIAQLRAVIKPLREAMSAIKKIQKESMEHFTDQLHGLSWVDSGLFDTETESSSSDAVMEAAKDFLDKWRYALEQISNNGTVIANNLQSTVDDFLATESEVKYNMLLQQRAEEAKADSPVSSFVLDHVSKPLSELGADLGLGPQPGRRIVNLEPPK